MLVTKDEILNPTVSLPPKSIVKDLCRQYASHIKYSWDGHDFFIKHRNVTMAAAHAQHFFHNQVKANPHSTIRIPVICHAWREPGTSLVYIVMECIHVNVEQPATDEQKAMAITEIINIPPPPSVFGSLNGDRIQHPFFAEDEGPIGYHCVEHIETYVNRVLTCLASVMPKLLQVDFKSEPLVCYVGDLRKENFPIDIHGQLWIVDFRLAGVFPESFASYVLDRIPRNRLPVSIRDTIPVEKSKNWMGMNWAAGFINMAAEGTFWFDGDEEKPQQ